jgi:hypothetical protein
LNLDITDGVKHIGAHVVQKTLKSSCENEGMPEVDTLIIVASHLAPTYRELEPPYLEICAVLSNGLVQGYQHYVESYPGFVAHPESLSEIIILLGARPFFDNKKQVGFVHYRRIFALDPDEPKDQNYTQDLRDRYACAGTEAKFLPNYLDQVVVPKPMALDNSVYDHFLASHAPLERALDVACLAFDASLKDIFGIVDSKSDLENTQQLYAWNMWIGNSDFYNEWVALLFPALKALDDISASLPSDGYQYRWSGFISERLFTVYINLCLNTNRWDFVERPVIFFEDIAEAERDIAEAERDIAEAERDIAEAERDRVVLDLERVLRSKSWTTTRFLRVGDKFLQRLFLSLKK